MNIVVTNERPPTTLLRPGVCKSLPNSLFWEMEMHTAERASTNHALFIISGLISWILVEVIRPHADENIMTSHPPSVQHEVVPHQFVRWKYERTIERTARFLRYLSRDVW